MICAPCGAHAGARGCEYGSEDAERSRPVLPPPAPVLTCAPHRASLCSNSAHPCFWQAGLRASGTFSLLPTQALSKAGGDVASLASVNVLCQLFLAPQLWSQLAYFCQVGLGLELVKGYTNQYLLGGHI
uniref:Uncharacterized protein n=1 Tax=Myotis myotis TaxID=51298 RepID=A0A7J7Y0D5_MYOMY|nr:hypothetical protein mMyoMyo1_011444 [Myotis myotis]